MPATDVERLAILIEANTKSYERAMVRLQGDTQRALRGVQRQYRSLNAPLAALERRAAATGAALGFGGLFAGGLALRGIANYADEWKRTGNLLAAAGVATGDLEARQRQLVDMAIKTRSEYGAVSELYARLMRNSKGLGLSTEDLANATETVAMAFKAGGASASEQAAGIMQLGQAIGSGVAAGDELKSLRENATVLAQAIADEFGTTVAGLKALGAAGVLTSDRIVKAILHAQSGIREQFERTNETIADSFTNLSTALTEYVGLSDKATGASRQVVGIIDSIASAVRDADSAFGQFSRDIHALLIELGGFVTLWEQFRATKTSKEGLDFLRDTLRGELGLGPPNARQQAQQAAQEARVSPTAFGGPGGGASASGAASALSATSINTASTKATNRLNDLQFEIEQLGRSNRAQAIYNELHTAGVSIDSELGQKIADMTGRLYDAREAQAQFNAKMEYFGGLALNSFDALIIGGENLNDVLADLAKNLAYAALQATLLGQGPLAGMFGTAPTGANTVGGIFGSLFGGFRAGGGPVAPGRGYIVGERGPELFMPRSAGSIAPNGAMGGGPVVHVANTYVFNDVTPGVESRIRGQLESQKSALKREIVASLKTRRARDPQLYNP